MSKSDLSELSVIIITPDSYETIRKTIEALGLQTVKDCLEILIVAPSQNGLGIDFSEMEGFYSYKVVEVGEIKSTAQARAEGVRRASAPVVAFAEDHCFPAPGWAEALINRHKGPWAAVGPVFDNANSDTMLSWANFLVEYGEWISPNPGGEVSHIPGHNSSYKRLLLLEYGNKLGEFLEAESVIQWDLVSKGHKLYLEPAARTSHLNYSIWPPTISVRFHTGRSFADSRCRGWSILKRFTYFCGAPLIPLVRLLRILRELKKPGRRIDLLPRLLPALVLTLAFDGMGEMAGYLTGAGDSVRILSFYEFHRTRYLTEKDRGVQNKR